MNSPMLYLGIGLLILGLFFLWQSGRKRRSTGLPGGRVIYTDTRTWGPVEQPFYDPELGLSGKPDYLVEREKALIPVEVKTSRIPQAPYDSHIYQLAVYCLLVDRVLGKRPPHGLLHYQDRSNQSRTFVVDYTPELESAVLDLLDEMRALDKRKELHRSHDDTIRCKRCGFRGQCPENLAAGS